MHDMHNVSRVASAAEAMPPQRGLHPLYCFRKRLELAVVEVAGKSGVGGETNRVPVLSQPSQGLQRHPRL
jgi:hypothetical protein